MIALNGWVVKETEKAVFFLWENREDNYPICLPKSQITIIEPEWDDQITIPKWLAAKNGLWQYKPPTPILKKHEMREIQL